MFCTEIQIRANLCRKWANEQDFVRGSSFQPPKGHIFDNFCFGARIFFLCQNLDLCKFVYLFNWKWVDEQDSVGGLSFFGQILSFWTPKRHFFENSRFGGYFILCQNSDSGKFVQLFDWKWVNEQDSIGCSSFFGQIPSFRPQKWYFFQKFHFAARFFFLRQNSNWHKFMQFFDSKWVNEQDSIKGSTFFGQILSFRSMTWHFFSKIFIFVLIFLHRNSDSHKFVQPFDWQWVNE